MQEKQAPSKQSSQQPKQTSQAQTGTSGTQGQPSPKPANASQSSAQQSQAPKEAAEITFRRLANKRVTKAVNAVRLISNLSRYTHTDEQAAKIVNALRESVQDVEQAFSKTGRKGKQEFSV